jgi:hypothetical protein
VASVIVGASAGEDLMLHKGEAVTETPALYQRHGTTALATPINRSQSDITGIIKVKQTSLFA